MKRPLRKNPKIIELIKNPPLKPKKQYITHGLFMGDIESILKKIPGFLGVFHLENLKNIEAPASNNKIISFIILHKSHYRAVIIDMKNTHSLMYYDPFGRPPEKETKLELYKIIIKYLPRYLLKYKINRVNNQRSNSQNCGLLALGFIIEIVKNNKSFISATKFKKREAEAIARARGAILKKFNYI